MQEIKQVNKDHYFTESYCSTRRFISFAEQIKNIINTNPDSVLEVGIGNGFVSDFIRKKGLNITTVDFDKELNPDYTASIMELPFKNDSFDCVCCFEVLEHLPFKCFNTALQELQRVSKQDVLISLPDAGKCIPFVFPIPDPKYKVRLYRRLIEIPFLKKEHTFDGQHYWEINKKGYDLDFVSIFINRYFEIKDTYRLFSVPYHRFFNLVVK